MRLPYNPQSRELSNNMTPMIDVVFLLIIFFLVSSHLARQESRLPLELPTAASHLPMDLQPADLTINLLADGTWSIAGTVVDEAGLKQVLSEQRDKNGSGALIRVRTDRSASYRSLEPILRHAAVSGLPNISIAVNESSGGGGL